MVALAGGLHTRTHGDMPVTGQGMALHEASRPHVEPQTGTCVLIRVLVCHLERLLADQLPQMTPADAALAH